MATMTGPISKSAHGDGGTFSPKLTAPQGRIGGIMRSAEEAKRAFMSTRMSPSAYGSNVEAALTSKPKEQS